MSPAERKEEYTKQGRYYHRREIRSRLQASFQDFQLLNNLNPKDRTKVFAVPESDDRRVLDKQLTDAFQFIYAGLDSTTWFKQLVRDAIQNGEVERGNVEDPYQVDVDLDIEYVTTFQMERTAELIKQRDWHELTPNEIASFLRMASFSTDSFDKIIDTILQDQEESIDCLREQQK